MTNNEERTGIIVAHYGVAVDVRFDDTGDQEMIRVKRNSGHVVGDRVTVTAEVLERHERVTELSRRDARGSIHLVGANLDIIAVVAACEPLPLPGFIDRGIVAARAAGLTPLLVINKSDLDCFADYRNHLEATFGESVQIFPASAMTEHGIQVLSDFFAEGHRGIFVGPTGVGKSSILNAMLPELNLQTGEIHESKKRGRHTTTVSTLHNLAGGGELIDSPGFSDFGLVDINVPQLAFYFPGFEKATEKPCRFRDCKHREEPGCTVQELLEEGEIKQERYDTYLQILMEVEALVNEPKYRAMRHRRKKNS